MRIGDRLRVYVRPDTQTGARVIISRETQGVDELEAGRGGGQPTPKQNDGADATRFATAMPSAMRGVMDYMKKQGRSESCRGSTQSKMELTKISSKKDDY